MKLYPRLLCVLAACLLSAPVSAAPQGHAAAPIVNGNLEGNLPSVVAVFVDSELCTGTLIGCQTVLTAAHCICSDQLTGSACAQTPGLLDPSRVAVFSQHAGVLDVASVAVHPDYHFQVRGDLAILRLATPVAGIAPTPLNLTGRVAPGVQGVIAGFGRSSRTADDFGLKRSGKVTTAACTYAPAATHLCWNFEAPIGPVGLDSTACQGDSGGPLLVETGGVARLAGVTSGDEPGTCAPPDQVFAADVYVDRAWILERAGADATATSCGALPPAGSAEAPVVAVNGDLARTDSGDRHVLQVPPGADLLRVALNGDFGTANANFQLYVKPGAPPTPEDFLCESEMPGPYEFCELPSPVAGEWHVLVHRQGGSGAYQLTATTFGVSSSSCVPDATTLCLNNGRFRVRATWRLRNGQSGAGNMIPLTSDTGYFWFFDPANVEVVVKVLNACTRGNYWVFASGLTNVQVTLTVTDTQSGVTRTYQNPQGTPFQPIQDTRAFSTCP